MIDPRGLARFLSLFCVALCLTGTLCAQPTSSQLKRYLYVATPGVRDYLEYGGHGLLVFDIDDDHRFVKRIPTAGRNLQGRPMNVKGVAASAATQRIYVSTIQSLMAFDLLSEQMVWERNYEKGCDRMSMSPDGSIIYQPSFEEDDWYALDAKTGDVLATLSPRSRAHNTVYGLDGRFVYMAGLSSPWLSVADTSTHTIARKVGPFAHSIRPFTINADQSLAFVNVNELLGFEVGDLRTGKKLHRVEVEGFQQGPIKRHGCPSHGIAMTPDESEIWVADAANQRVHIFDATVMPPRQVADIRVRDEPGWITFSIDGTLAWPSTGDVVDVKTRKIIGALTDENGVAVQSEKLLEIDFRGGVPVRSGDQFGIGRVGMPVREVTR